MRLRRARLLPVLLLVPLLLDGLSLSVLRLLPLALLVVVVLLLPVLPPLLVLLPLLLLPLPLLKWEFLDAVQSSDNQWCGWLSSNGSYGIWSYLLIDNNLGLSLIQSNVGDNNIQFYLGIRICVKAVMSPAFCNNIPWIQGKSKTVVLVIAGMVRFLIA